LRGRDRFAKKHGGDFLIRIEDTDQTRYVPGAEDYIIEALKWVGIIADEGIGFGDGPHAPYRQSERKPMYRQYVMQLIDAGYAYYAFDTTEALESWRKHYESKGETFIYNWKYNHVLDNSLNILRFSFSFGNNFSSDG
jgi:glutamyl-tRNA synthetase